MPRETMKDLRDKIDRLTSENNLLRLTIKEYRDRMINAEIEADRLKKATAANEQPQNPQRGRPKKITGEQRQRVKDLHAAGGSVRTISKATGLSLGTIHRIIHADETTI